MECISTRPFLFNSYSIIPLSIYCLNNWVSLKKWFCVLGISFHVHMLLLSFSAEGLSFMKKPILCFIPQKCCAHHWDFLIITILLFWLIWQGALPDDIIRIWSAALISSCQVSVPHCSHNIAQLLDNFQFWYSSHKIFYIFITLHKTQVSGVANVKAVVPNILYL